MADAVIAVVLAPPALIAALLGVYLVRLYARQQTLLFRPRAEATDRSPADHGIDYREVFLECAGGIKAHAWWVAGTQSKAIVFFHGSDGNLSYELSTLRFLCKFGASVLMVDYPGYGRSEGHCSERNCYRAGDAAWAFVHQAQGVPARDVVLFGQSLGTAVATYIASSRTCGGLVFQSGFTSVPAIATGLFPLLPYWMFWVFARTRMNSLRRISSCECPALVMHSRGDEHISIEHARRIYGRAPGPKKFVELHGVHFSGDWRRDERVSTAWEELLGERTSEWEGRAAVAAGGAR